jgi:hypothetical protein
LWARDEAETAQLTSTRPSVGNSISNGAAVALPGRQTGSLQWRQARGEAGSDNSGNGNGDNGNDNVESAAEPSMMATKYALAKDEKVQ